MRINQPVTGREYRVAAKQTLVSVTDLKGRIVYCNPAFIAVSGYSKEELLGQPHNLVRHPDMPQEAFRDLWDTIQLGLSWSGLVKNRRKNGDHYWVQANATPMMDGDTITGYLSVRTAPSAEAVQGADRLYAGMLQEARAGRLVHALHRGRVVRRDWLGRLRALLSPGTQGQLAIVQVVAGLLIVVPAALGLSLWASLLAAACAATGASWLVWSLTGKPLRGLVADANRMASGDLSLVIKTGASGAIGMLQQAQMQLSVNLRTVVSDVREEVEQLRTVVREIASGNHDLSSRTEAQAGAVEQTAASMEEITGTVNQSAASAAHGAQMAHETSDVSRRGNEAVEAVSGSMTDITGASKRVQDITQLIEGVAFQTNILALNAAIEAARAGDAGRGFAVVATEVRSLAKRTATAAREIKQLITESSARVSSGNQHAEAALKWMHVVLESVLRVGAVLDEISATASEQKIGISQVYEAVSHIDSMTQQNAAMVEQLAAAAQSLYGQVESVSDSMRLFRLQRGETTLAQVDAVDLRRSLKAPPQRRIEAGERSMKVLPSGVRPAGFDVNAQPPHA